MASRLVVEDPARRFFAGLERPEDRARLAHCWRLLADDPHVDRITKFDFPVPPLVYRLQQRDGFATVYYVRGDTVYVRSAAWAGQRPSV